RTTRSGGNVDADRATSAPLDFIPVASEEVWISGQQAVLTWRPRFKSESCPSIDLALVSSDRKLVLLQSARVPLDSGQFSFTVPVTASPTAVARATCPDTALEAYSLPVRVQRPGQRTQH